MSGPAKVGIILQARIGSTRLPGKILLPLGRKNLLEHILFRLTRLRHEVQTVIATSDTPGDDVVASFCASHAVACFRGSESNVLDRYYRCAVNYGFQQVVRLTGDNPFPDIEELDNLLDLRRAKDCDFAHSFSSLPVGCGAEVFTFAALERSWQEGKQPHHLEHVDEYLLEHPEWFSTAILQVGADKHRPEVRLTVDTEADYRRACYIIEHSGTEYVSIPQAIRLAKEYATTSGRGFQALSLPTS
jgi:spore coat polysaccharide biosynthesis protein SpsF